VPFHVVGKHTAYAVKFTSTEFLSWDRNLARLQVRTVLSPSVRRDHRCRHLRVFR
jgi:hypothetical protein